MAWYKQYLPPLTQILSTQDSQPWKSGSISEEFIGLEFEDKQGVQGWLWGPLPLPDTLLRVSQEAEVSFQVLV